MAGLKEFYCRSKEISLGSQFKWLEYTFKSFLNYYREYFVFSLFMRWSRIAETVFRQELSIKITWEIDFGPIWISFNWLKIYIFVNIVYKIKVSQVPLKNVKHTWKGPQEYTKPTWNKVPLMLRPRGMIKKNIPLLLRVRNAEWWKLRISRKILFKKNRIIHCKENVKQHYPLLV